LAIGKEGQNARLAARLTGWRIDIRSDNPAGPQATPAPAGSAPPRGGARPGSALGGRRAPSGGSAAHDHASPR